MNDKGGDQDTFRTYQLMSELEAGEAISQRELASRLGIAVGLVNSCLKNFVAKGYVRVKAFPRNRYAYLLTPKGFAEKSRLAYHHLEYFASLYTTTRQEYLALFRCLKAEGVETIAFCGVDEVAEIAYLSLQEVGLELAYVLEVEGVCEKIFFGKQIHAISAESVQPIPIVITSLKRRKELFEELLAAGVAENLIRQADARSHL